MSQNYSRSLLRISVAQICQNLGWSSAQSSSLEVLTDVLERYLTQLGGICHRYSEQFGRTQPNLDDLGLAFKHMGINIGELEDYVKHVDPVPFAHDVVAFPARKTPTLGFPNPRSREILQQRDEHVDDHLPYMYPNMKDEVPEQKPKSPILTNDNVVTKTEPMIDESAVNGEVVGEKRSAPMTSTDAPPMKRQRVGNSLFPEEAGHSQYEMKCVFMGSNGVLTARPGCQGKLPEPRLPPPNPRNISENNKENKNKEAASGVKGSNAIGGIGVDGLNGKKSSKKSLLKKNLHAHDKASKLTIELSGKEVGKKSASSKAAAKFIKKLKMSKTSAKLFGKSKSKEKDSKKFHNGPEEEGMKENVGKSHTDKAQKGTRKKRKEKKSVAILDFDEELRNLSSPSSSPSGDPSSSHEGDGDRRKARMEAINDSINSVLREGADGTGKTKKKKKVVKLQDSDVKTKEGGAHKGDEKNKDKLKKQKAIKANRKNKDKKPEPPPIDIKPFVSEKYSSAELMVYEFNDSPPDASSVKARRPSAPDGNSPPHQTISHSPAPKSSSSHSHSHHKVKHIEPEEELFAPEIKIESRADLTVKPLKLDLSKEKEKEKHKSKDDKKEKNDEEKHKAREDKSSKVKDKKDKHRDEEKPKDKHKDKEVKKDKKDKKKDKEKKKKHKEKDRDRDKEKEKKREEKIKQEARESRESSPVIGMGVKLKIKIGGSAGPTSSMMVTGDNSSPDRASPAPPKRESMSPPKIPRLFISKKGQEEKSKKGKHGNKGKPSPVTMSVKSRSSSPVSNAPSPSKSRDRTPPSKNPSPTPSRKTPTPPPRAFSHSPQPKGPYAKDVSETKKSKPIKDKPGRLSRKDKGKKREPKSASVSPVPPKSSKKLRQRPSRVSHVSSSPERSPHPLPAKSPSATSRIHSPSPSTSRHSHSPSPSPSLSKRKITPPPPLSPAVASRNGSGSRSWKQVTRTSSQSPSKPPTPGSTSPAASPEWSYPVSPSRPSPTPPPRTPTGSPRRVASPAHSSPPRTPNVDRSPSPSLPHSPQDTSGPTDASTAVSEFPSPGVPGKSGASTAKNRTVEAETVCVFIDDSGQKVWICPACKSPDDGSEMIGCDTCDNWYHWTCVNITQAPPEEQQWFCGPCIIKNKSVAKGTRGRGRPRGRGRGRGRKKIT